MSSSQGALEEGGGLLTHTWRADGVEVFQKGFLNEPIPESRQR